MSDEEKRINRAIAVHLGYWVYHYDKGMSIASCYYLLVDSEFTPVAWPYPESQRATVEEAFDDVPAWTDSTDNSLSLLTEDRLYFRLEWHDYEYHVTVKRKKHSRESVLAGDTDLSTAVCKAYLLYHKQDWDTLLPLEVA
jgi:hypothetical protein